jgi:transcriptional regulator with XRE-family HTH domain
LARFIHSYEEAHAKIREATRPEVLRSLMEAHGLTQSELPEIGSQGVVSEILSSERELNVRQIRRLAKRFEVYPCRLHRRHMRAEGSDATGIKLPVKSPGLDRSFTLWHRRKIGEALLFCEGCAEKLLETAINESGLSARAYSLVLNVGRTVAKA